MTDAAKLHNVRTELPLLTDTWRASPFAATDIRAALKKKINTKLGSTLVEEKSYADYTRKA